MKRKFLALKAHITRYETIKSDFDEVVDGTWAYDDDLHLTICFFGQRYELDELLDKLPKVVKNIEPLRLDSLEFFPHNNILYARANSDEVERLCSSVCEHFSIKVKKPYILHVTLMRIKKIKDKKRFKELLQNYKNVELGMVDTTISLMQNSSSKDGLKYETIKRFE